MRTVKEKLKNQNQPLLHQRPWLSAQQKAEKCPDVLSDLASARKRSVKILDCSQLHNPIIMESEILYRSKPFSQKRPRRCQWGSWIRGHVFIAWIKDGVYYERSRAEVLILPVRRENGKKLQSIAFLQTIALDQNTSILAWWQRVRYGVAAFDRIWTGSSLAIYTVAMGD